MTRQFFTPFPASSSYAQVVLTVLCGILFAHFCMVDYVSDQGEKKGGGKAKAFLKNKREKDKEKTIFVSNTLCSRLQHTYFS